MGGILSGNPNCKTHGSTARYICLDSFSFNRCQGLPRCVKTKKFHFLVDNHTVTVSYRPKGAERNTEQEIAFTQVPNNYGGRRLYFCCPFCGERVRKLYLYDRLFRCRKCARLNYPSQQVTKGCDHAYLKMRKAVKPLDPEAVNLSPHELSQYRPERPKNMRHNTYYKLLRTFYRSQDEYAKEWMRTAGAILRRGP